jgi:hypothetical protein
MRVIFSINSCTMPQRRKPFDISLSRLVPLSPWYTDGTRRFVFRSRICWPTPSRNLRRFALFLRTGVRGDAGQAKSPLRPHPSRSSERLGSLLLESISQIPIFGIARNLFDALRGISFCWSGRGANGTATSTPSGGVPCAIMTSCPMASSQ